MVFSVFGSSSDIFSYPIKFVDVAFMYFPVFYSIRFVARALKLWQ